MNIMRKIHELTLAIALLVVTAPPAAAQDAAPLNLLLTRPGWEVGGQVSKYKYEEPATAIFPGVSLEGPRIGAVGAYTSTIPNRVYSRIDLRVSYGNLDYESPGSGSRDNIPDWIFETRLVVGRDYPVGEKVALSPYIGLGYRYLYNDFRGYDTVGNTTFVGYRRYSQYWYAPIGLTMRMRTGAQWVFAPTVEYDAFIGGKQETKLSDAGVIQVDSIVGVFPDVTNKQERGRGYRVSLMFESDRWALGPWMHYWNIKDSEIEFGGGVPWYEPANKTTEYGFELRYRF